MHVPRRAALWAAAFAIFRAAPVAAQTDFRNLDEGRPTHTEDALPVDRYGFVHQSAALTSPAQTLLQHIRSAGPDIACNKDERTSRG